MNTVAIIPARGGSKRIPRKNIKPFLSKPIIAYSIEAANSIGIFDRVIVSTDSEEIADIAVSYGAQVPFMRPAELSDDFTGTSPVLLHALNWLKKQNSFPEYFCCIYATAPFIQPKYLLEGLNALKSNHAATAFSVTSFPYTIFRALKINSNGRLEMFWPENLKKRSQDFKEAYHDAGQFYWGDSVKFERHKTLITQDSIPVILPRYLVQDIDNLEDWSNAELLYHNFIQKSNCEKGS